jgi:protein-tyrosine phosphatase
MRAELYWICKIENGRLATMPRPRGGDWLEDEISSLKQSGVDALISLLENHENHELDLEREEACCENAGILFLSYPIRDRCIPSSGPKTRQLAQVILDLLRAGKNVAIHCRGGIGRSSVIAACVMMLSGMTSDEALLKVEDKRGCLIPDTTEQREWVKEFLLR